MNRLTLPSQDHPWPKPGAPGHAFCRYAGRPVCQGHQGNCTGCPVFAAAMAKLQWAEDAMEGHTVSHRHDKAALHVKRAARQGEGEMALLNQCVPP